MSTHQPDNNQLITPKITIKACRKLLKLITYHDESDHNLSYYEYAGYAIVNRNRFWTVHNQMQVTPSVFYKSTFDTPEAALAAIIDHEK